MEYTVSAPGKSVFKELDQLVSVATSIQIHLDSLTGLPELTEAQQISLDALYGLVPVLKRELGRIASELGPLPCFA